MLKWIRKIICYHEFKKMSFGMNFKDPDQRVTLSIYDECKKCGHKTNYEPFN
jgi:hypothetical protein